MNLRTFALPVTRAKTWLRTTCTALALLTLAACGGGSSSQTIDRGPTTIEIQAKLNGLYWDADAARLYLTDDDASVNAIKTWDGEKGFSVAHPLPAMAADQRTTLGQVTRATNGTLYVTRFGFGSYGTVVVAPRTGQTYNLAGLAGDRRRIAMTATTDGKLLTGWFRGGGSGPSGVISELTLGAGTTASEQDLITGLSKPAGLAITGDQVFITDQGSGKVLAYSLAAVRKTPATVADGRLIAQFTPADSLDLMTADADGALYFGDGSGTLYAVAPNGTVKTLASGWPSIRGVALDAANKRLFVAVSAAASGEPSSIRIVPIN